MSIATNKIVWVRLGRAQPAMEENTGDQLGHWFASINRNSECVKEGIWPWKIRSYMARGRKGLVAKYDDYYGIILSWS
jgi:hypothetical protein